MFDCRAFIPYDVDGVGLFSVPSAFAQNHIDEAMDGPFTVVGIAPLQIFTDLDSQVAISMPRSHRPPGVSSVSPA